jgi:hypothetical protein
MAALAEQAGGCCHHFDPAALTFEGERVCIGDIRLQPATILLAAGAGNPGLLHRLGRERPAMQRRPLHMVMVSGRLPPVYAHAMEASANPRITITSYPLPDGEQLWYLGGNLAERGVVRSPAEQIRAARRELGALLPWLDWSSLKWATLEIHRAEVASPGGRRPDDAFLERQGRLLVAWPTKLAFAPRLADLVLNSLPAPGGGSRPALPLAAPPLARLPWLEASWS